MHFGVIFLVKQFSIVLQYNRKVKISVQNTKLLVRCHFCVLIYQTKNSKKHKTT